VRDSPLLSRPLHPFPLARPDKIMQKLLITGFLPLLVNGFVQKTLGFSFYGDGRNVESCLLKNYIPEEINHTHVLNLHLILVIVNA